MEKKRGKFYLPSTSTSPHSTPARGSSQPSVSTSSEGEDDDDDLPYPQPLPRDPFLSPDFSASSYLSSLRNRHQTLSDLRNELRQRSATLGQELLNLVNGEYQAFLDLGRDLRGGEEKVEGVRIGVLGFVNGVEGVKEQVRKRREEVGTLLLERKRVVREIEMAKGLLEVHTRLGELEDELMVEGDRTARQDWDGAVEDEDEDSEDDEDAEVGAVNLARLQRLVRSYVATREMARSLGPEHPFLVTQEERMVRVRNTMLLDLSTALKQAKQLNAQNRVLRILSLYREMDAAAEAVKVLKDG